jgi:hypothetical protein
MLYAGHRGPNRMACNELVDPKWSLLGPRRDFQAVVERQSEKQIHCIMMDLAIVAPTERLQTVNH